MHPFPETTLKDQEAQGIETDSLPQSHESRGSNGSTRPPTRMGNVTPLPCPEYARKWESIQRSKPTKQPLQHYARHTKELADQRIPRSTLDISGVVILCGEPGVGKTTLANGFANEFAKIQGQPTHLYALPTERLFSELLGQSVKELAKTFVGIRLLAEQSPCVVLVDELESISFARNQVINSSDPSDLVRFVDQLFRDIDSLQQYPQTIVVGTTNFPSVIDQAFWSRADLVLTIPLPDLPTRQAILQARMRTLSPLGLMLSGEELTVLARETEGMSGRTLGKLFPRTYFEKGVAYEDMGVEDVLETLAKERMKKETP